MKRKMMNMINLCLQQFLGRGRSAIIPFAILAMWVMNQRGLPGLCSAIRFAELPVPTGGGCSNPFRGRAA